MKVWPIDPLVPRNLRLEVPEKLPQVNLDVRTTMAQVYDLLAVYPVGSQPEDDDYSYVSSQSSSDSCTPVPSPAYGAHHVWRTSRLFASHKVNLERLARVGPVVQHGWCELVNKATTKQETGVPLALRQGYIQLSFDGLNHVRPVSVGSLKRASILCRTGGSFAPSGRCCLHAFGARPRARSQSSLPQLGVQVSGACDLGEFSRESAP
jgi:hypothetical protein